MSVLKDPPDHLRADEPACPGNKNPHRIIRLKVFDAPLVGNAVIERVKTRGSGRVVWVRGTIRYNSVRRTHSLHTIPNLGRNDDQRIIIRPQKNLHKLISGWGVRSIIIQHELDSTFDAGVVQGHLSMFVPAFDYP